MTIRSVRGGYGCCTMKKMLQTKNTKQLIKIPTFQEQIYYEKN